MNNIFNIYNINHFQDVESHFIRFDRIKFENRLMLFLRLNLICFKRK